MTCYLPRWFNRPQTVTHPSTNPAVHGWELNSQPVDHKSDALTTTPPSHLHAVLYVLLVLCTDWSWLALVVVGWIQIRGYFLVISLPWHSMPSTTCSRLSHCGCCIARRTVPRVYLSARAALYFHSSGLSSRQSSGFRLMIVLLL